MSYIQWDADNNAHSQNFSIATPPGSKVGSSEECSRLLKELHRRKLTETRMADEIDQLERERAALKSQLAEAADSLRERQRELASASTDLEVSRAGERGAVCEAERSRSELDKLRVENARLKRELEDRIRDGALLVVDRENTIRHLQQALHSAISWALENDEAGAVLEQAPSSTDVKASTSSTTLDVDLGWAPSEIMDYFETYDTSECSSTMRKCTTPVRSILQTEPRSSLRSRRSGLEDSGVLDLRSSPGCVSEAASSRASNRSADMDSHDSSNCSTNPGMPNGRPKFSLGPVSREPRRRRVKNTDAGAVPNACPTQ